MRDLVDPIAETTAYTLKMFSLWRRQCVPKGAPVRGHDDINYQTVEQIRIFVLCNEIFKIGKAIIISN